MWNPHIIRETMDFEIPADITVRDKEKELLRRLAAQVREISELPIMEERRRLWRLHNDLASERPMLLADPEGAWMELIPDSELECESPLLRWWEITLKKSIFNYEKIGDDDVVEPWFDIPWDVSIGEYGVHVTKIYGENRGSYTWKHPLENLDEDLQKLKYRDLQVNRELTHKKLGLAQDIFGDTLPTRIHGKYWWSVGMTADIVHLVGLEDFMLYMYDNPEGVHRLMKWFRDEHLHCINWFERENLLQDTCANEYVGSGGIAYTTELPRRKDPAGAVMLSDIWGHSESQETVGLSPDMFKEFIFPYQKPLIEKFGLACYGCCEAIDQRMATVLEVDNIRRLSVSPWADEEKCAEMLGRNYVYSRKPNPAHICVGFDEDAVRASLEKTLTTAKGCNLEFNMKDTHTLQNDRERPGRWVKIARELIDRHG